MHAAVAGPAPDHLAGRAARLRPLVPADYPLLYELATTGRAALSWRLRGRSVSPETFASMLWNDSLSQFTICEAAQPWAVVGHIAAFNCDPVGRHAYVSVLLAEDVAGVSTVLGETMLLFVRHLWTAFNLRKVYAETSELALPGVSALSRRFAFVAEEGRLREHLLVGGETADLVIIAIWVEQLLAEAHRFLAYLHRGEDRSRGMRPAVSFAEFSEFVRTQSTIDGAVIEGGTLLRDELGIDSLGLLELVVAIEETFRVRAPDDRLVALRSVQDLYSLVAPD